MVGAHYANQIFFRDIPTLLFSDHKFIQLMEAQKIVVDVQSLSDVQLFMTQWTAGHQPSLSFTIPQSFLKLTSIESVMPSNHLIFCYPLLFLPSIFPIIRVLSNESALHIRWSSISPSASVLPMNIQRLFPLRLTGLFSCCPRDSLESSPAPQFKASILWHSAFCIVQFSRH